MEINRDTLLKIAHLARLNFSSKREKEMLDGLNDMITWVEKLQEVDTEGVEPLTNMSQEINAWCDDEVKTDLTREQALKNAPKTDNKFFKVPKVLK
ncbi:MAG: aspartyl/glutamyl-tRNA(Asn/Gln) amidotransferase subunit C [Cyclobacteriaceae bacterium]|nr:MAG: aspartyl/glutamyl-tRNA(Asn/Gln) amidotransferase subunit C [Cyclobacteriaceae bacterium]